MTSTSTDDLGADITPSSHEPFELPAGLAPSEDSTFRAQAAFASDEFPSTARRCISGFLIPKVMRVRLGICWCFNQIKPNQILKDVKTYYEVGML